MRPPVTPAPARVVEALDEIALLARGSELTAGEREALGSIDSTGARRFVASLVDDPRVAEQARIILFPWSTKPPSLRTSPLSTGKTRSGETYFYFDKPCRRSDLVEVAPWWDLDTKVLVCRQNHRPERLFDPMVGYLCQPSTPGCGCGPNLIMCSPSAESAFQQRLSHRAEFVDTVVHLIRRGAPLRELFLTNATVRDRVAELWYRRARVVAGEPIEQVFADYQEWPDKGVWAPRPESAPGQEAGVLTTAHALWQHQGPRERMQLLQQDLWCVEARSVKVTTPELFGLGATDFRELREEGLKLAEKPVCETCHARLDHGLAFLFAHEKYVFIRPRDPAARAKLFIRDSRDYRGEDVALPAGFARLATAAPEFGQCMARRVVDHVLGGEAERGDYRAVHRAYEERGEYRALLRTALERLLDRRLGRGAEPEPARGLRALLDRHCSDCHSSGERVDLSRPRLDATTLRAALEEVSSGRMPRGFPPLGAAARARVIEALIAAWPLPAERDGLRRTFTAAMRAHQAMRPEAVQQAIHQRVGLGEPPDPDSIPYPYRLLDRRNIAFTPDLMIFTAIEAVKACKKARPDEELAACAERASSGLLGR